MRLHSTPAFEYAGQTQLVPDTTGAQAPSVSPDGARLAFVRESATAPKNDDIWVIDLD